MNKKNASLRRQYRFHDFTEHGYCKLLAAALSRFRFRPFGTRETRPHALWRHDVDFSVHRALRLATLEARVGARSTFFFWLHSPFYSLLEKSVVEKARAIADLGHYVGLHFDARFYGQDKNVHFLERKMAWERSLLEDVFGTRIDVVSFHDPDPTFLAKFEQDLVCGMINAYGPRISARYKYCSDSNGYWRNERLFDVIADARVRRLHALTHPEWWVPRPLSPRQRVRRCIEGRAARVSRGYDEALRRSGRLNVGKRT